MSTDMFPDAALEHIVSMESLQNRLAVAYTTAIAAQRRERSGRVSIHVSSDIWEAFQRFLQETLIGDDRLPLKTFWGFPIIHESAWESGRIVVRSDEEIW